jgi:hypothetical protein
MTLTIYIVSVIFEQMTFGYSLEKIRRSNEINLIKALDIFDYLNKIPSFVPNLQRCQPQPNKSLIII